jgi:hypothetical protein
MIDSLYDVIHVDGTVRDADGVGLKDVARLVVRQSAALDVVRVIGQVYLRPMIDAAFQPRCFLFSQDSQ